MRLVKSLAFDPSAFEDLAWWMQQDRKKVLPLVKLIKEVQRTPFTGTGKPEALNPKWPVAGPGASMTSIGSIPATKASHCPSSVERTERPAPSLSNNILEKVVKNNYIFVPLASLNHI